MERIKTSKEINTLFDMISNDEIIINGDRYWAHIAKSRNYGTKCAIVPFGEYCEVYTKYEYKEI